MTQHTALQLLTEQEKEKLGSAITTQPNKIFGFEVNPLSLGAPVVDQIFQTSISPVVTTLGALSNIEKENIASKVVNPEQNIFSTIGKAVLPSAISGESSIDVIKDRADVNRDNVVTQQEFDLYSKNFIDRNVPTSKVTVTRLSPIQSREGTIGGYEGQNIIPQPLLTRPKTNIVNTPPMGVGSTGNLAGAEGTAMQGRPFGVGGTQTAKETTVTDTFADDAATSDTGDDATFICTALYDMGDMKTYIYKYDQTYGKKVNPAIYRGYTLWGKYIADKIRNRGLIYKVVRPMALAWAYQMAYELSKGKVGKKSKLVKIIKTIGEGICFALGKTIRRR